MRGEATPNHPMYERSAAAIGAVDLASALTDSMEWDKHRRRQSSYADAVESEDNAQAQALEALRTPAASRDREQLGALAAYTRKLAFFQQLPKDVSFLIVRHAHATDVHTMQPVVREGDDGNAFYILFQGSCSVHNKSSLHQHAGKLTASEAAEGAAILEKDQEAALERKYGARLNVLVTGSSFGELSLRAGGTRTASVVAREQCVLMHVSKSVFDRTLYQLAPAANALSEDVKTVAQKPHNQRSMQERKTLVHGIRSLSCLSHLTYDAALVAAANCSYIRLPKRSCPLMQGHAPEDMAVSFNVIVTGSVSVHLRDDCKPAQPQNRLNRYGGLSVCAANEDLLQQFGPASTVLGPGRTYGGEALLLSEFVGNKPKDSVMTIITREQTECLSFSVQGFYLAIVLQYDYMLMRPERAMFILNKAPEERTFDELEELISYVYLLKFFRGLPDWCIRELCAKAQVRKVAHGQPIIKQWTFGNTFYVALSGLFTVHRDNSEIADVSATDEYYTNDADSSDSEDERGEGSKRDAGNLPINHLDADNTEALPQTLSDKSPNQQTSPEQQPGVEYAPFPCASQPSSKRPSGIFSSRRSNMTASHATTACTNVEEYSKQKRSRVSTTMRGASTNREGVFYGPILRFLQAGDCFGQHTLEGGQRSATVVNVSRSGATLLELPKSAFKEIVVKGENETRSKLLQMLRNIEPLERLDSTKLGKVADCFTHVARLRQQILCERGSRDGEIHLLASGEAAVEQPPQNARKTRGVDEHTTNSPSSTVVSLLCPEALIGTAPMLFDRPHPVTIRANKPSTVYVADGTAVMKLLPQEVVTELREYIRPQLLYEAERVQMPRPRAVRPQSAQVLRSIDDANKGAVQVREDVMDFSHEDVDGQDEQLRQHFDRMRLEPAPRRRGDKCVGARLSSLSDKRGKMEPRSSRITSQPGSAEKDRSRTVSAIATPRRRSSCSRNNGWLDASKPQKLQLCGLADDATRGFARSLMRELDFGIRISSKSDVGRAFK